MTLIGLKLLSNEVIAKICCRLKFSATMASRFVEADEEFIEELRNTSENKNRKRGKDYCTNIFQQWVKKRGKNEQLESYEVPELNEALAQFFAELRKENGKDYEPDSLKVMQAALDSHLKSKNYPKSIMRDTEFLSSRKVLERSARKRVHGIPSIILSFM